MDRASPTPQGVTGRWPADHVLAFAHDGAAAAAARRAAVPTMWSALGSDDDGLWGMHHGTGSEPYQVVVELRTPTFRCSCPSRRAPCKHALALLLMWAQGAVESGLTRPASVAAWLSKRLERRSPDAGTAELMPREADPEPPDEAPARVSRGGTGERVSDQAPTGGSDRRAAERAARVSAGLAELDRWLADRIRGGLTDPALAKYATWDAAVARLVDAQVPSLANRLRRLAGTVGLGPEWHEHVLGELGVLHLLAEAGRRLASLPADLADAVRTALGFTVRQADVLDTAPVTDRWRVMGRSDTLEDRIVVRRTWLRGERCGEWALLLSFAAYGQSLEGALPVGGAINADLHRYPGRHELRVALGVVHVTASEATADAPNTPRREHVVAAVPAQTTSVAGACNELGTVLAGVPWIERWPVTIAAAPTIVGGRWVLVDHTGSLPLVPAIDGLSSLVALSGGAELAITAEWTARGLVPLSTHLADRHIDIGPRGGFHERRWDRAS
jgi:SWIM zinc finger